jgi:hypothetical protein
MGNGRGFISEQMMMELNTERKKVKRRGEERARTGCG